MFEEMTKEVILDEMLDRVPDTIDKREGSIIYDALSPIAEELAQVYADMDMVLDETFADTADEYYLIKRASEQGILQKNGTAAVLKIKVEPETVVIENGVGFNVGELNYKVTENLGSGYYAITCDDTGTEGNNTAEDIIPIDYIDGLEGVSIVSIISSGTDEEDEDSLRNRYYDSFTKIAGNGNQEYYREEAVNCIGVGAAKVEPLWNGEGTVKIYILANGYEIPSTELVTSVQNTIDRYQDGLGKNKAMIGHIVTVVPASQEPIAVKVSLLYEDGYTFEDVKDSIYQAISSYMYSVSEDWGTEEHITVRRGEIESLILAMNGILDVQNVMLNDSSGNIIISGYSVPVLEGIEEVSNG